MAEKKQNKRRWIVGAALLVILLILGLAGSCMVSERTALGWKDDDYLFRQWVGEIVSIEINSFAGDSVVVVSVAMKKYPLVARSRSPLVAN
ncbi:hypothetical protein R4P47_23595 [Rhodococcus sp. IEGM 1370]|uniref:hypothetical protein n=1 Tax=Rhodococcus sp. IEGM 1370 TaxID=3082222 RepID=UPI00295323D4|nr:hypothetical protein [Rhodococcus sp. IEGM 1370]MDV8079558.1 hypothetical protein [Rhodococcus sp. IEGM 1370]